MESFPLYFAKFDYNCEVAESADWDQVAIDLH